jgi:hypothetical protein
MKEKIRKRKRPTWFEYRYVFDHRMKRISFLNSQQYDDVILLDQHVNQFFLSFTEHMRQTTSLFQNEKLILC